MGDLGGEHDVFTGLGDIHRLEDSGYDLLVVEFDVSSVAFQYTFYHSVMCQLGAAPALFGRPDASKVYVYFKVSFQEVRVWGPEPQGQR